MRKYIMFLAGILFISLLTIPFLLSNAPEYWYMGIIASIIFGYFMMILSVHWDSSLSYNHEIGVQISGLIQKMSEVNEMNKRIIENQTVIKTAMIKVISEASDHISKSVDDAFLQSMAQWKENAEEIKKLNGRTEVLSVHLVQIAEVTGKVVSETNDVHSALEELYQTYKEKSETKLRSMDKLMMSIEEKHHYFCNLCSELSERIEKQMKVSYEKQNQLAVDFTNRLCNMIHQNKEVINETLANSADKISTDINKVSDHLSVIDDFVILQQKGMDTLVNEIKSTYELYESYRMETHKMIEHLGKIILAFEQTNENFNTTVVGINNCVSSSIKTQDNVLEELKQGSRDMSRNIENSLESVEDSISGSLQSLKDCIKDSLENLVEQVDALSTAEEMSYDNLVATNEYIKKIFSDKKLENQERELIAKLERACKKY